MTNSVWLVLSLMVIGCIMAGINDFYSAKFAKRGASENIPPAMVVAGILLGATLFLFIVWVFRYNQGAIDLPKQGFWTAVFTTSILASLMYVLIFTAYTKADITLVQPIWAVAPVFMIFSAWILAKEVPGVLGIIGILAIVSGVYTLNKKDKWSLNNMWSPFLNVWKNAGTKLYLLAMIPPVVSIVYDKKAVLASDPLTMSMFNTLIIGVATLSYALISNRGKKIKISGPWIKRFLLVGFLLAVAAICYNTAISMALISYIGALKRLSILITVIMAYFLLREKTDFKQRLIASLIMVSGAVMIGIALA